ncbi:hypothetical protein J0383_02265 [Flavobacterium endoglycinae]|uniref:DUF4878 domain-containing protein n=1 Tax=Flavobacterium endoglycinae TaxID=2816357 RepID=A0ABX7QGP7_9FLAO|nr:hypothetical protein [Flavobacterium endoglycinae]QSW89648.1 hypothetical protein J0383_02265 [Flavobacterium endoglycinae]
MRRVISFLVILTLFTNCKSHQEAKSPKETVEAYLAATNRFDFEVAKELLIPTKENQLTLETLKKMEKSLPDNQKKRFLNKEKKAVYYEKEITGSTAKIIVSLDQNTVTPFEFNLKKTNETWLIESIIQLQ